MNKLILEQHVFEAYDGYLRAFIKGDKKKLKLFKFY